MKTPRVVWRVMTLDREHWLASATEAYLLAKSYLKDEEEPEIDRVVLKRGVSVLDLLNRTSIVESAVTVPKAVWKHGIRKHGAYKSSR